MASNPIQKKVRNAGLIGAAVTLLIMGVVVVFLLLQMSNMKKEQEEIKASFRTIYTLNTSVQSGDIITADMLQQSQAQVQHIPTDAPSTSDMLVEFENQSLTDSTGNTVDSDDGGAFLQRTCDYTVVFEGEDGYYTYSVDGKQEKITGIDKDDIYEDSVTGNLEKYIVKSCKKDRLYYDADEYYVLELKEINGKVERVRKTEKIYGIPLIAKINMSKNTVLTMDMVSKGSPVTDDIRKQEYNAVILPTDLATGDYIDIRVMLPNGQDFIVVSKKSVEIPVINGMDSENTIWVNLSEDEILTMSCAIVEAYRINGTKIYATKYTDPGMQEAAKPTYPVSAETIALIQSDPNVTNVAEQKLLERYTNEFVNIRNQNINKELQKEENSEANVPSKMNESIVKTQEERKKYLQSLANSQY